MHGMIFMQAAEEFYVWFLKIPQDSVMQEGSFKRKRKKQVFEGWQTAMGYTTCGKDI